LHYSHFQAHTFEDFKETVMPMLLALGPYAYHDGVLLYKILRILKSSLRIPSDESGKEREKIAEPVDPTVSCLYYDVLTIMDEVMLPATSLMESPNCCLAEEIWSILRVYPYHMRYRYGSKKSRLLRGKPDLEFRAAISLFVVNRALIVLAQYIFDCGSLLPGRR
jgi:hypothetical protein